MPAVPIRTLTLLLAILTTVCVGAQNKVVKIDYVSQIKPLLAAKCYACHGALKQEGSLRLETQALMRTGGDSGEAVIPGNAEDSNLLLRISSRDNNRMPPPHEGEMLDGAQINLIRNWIAQGAHAPEEQTPTDPRLHWAFQKPVQVTFDMPKKTHQNGNPIDALLARQHKSHNLVQLGPANKYLQLRRIYLDLVGLPPTSAQMQAFLRDDTGDAYEQIVDQLLNSPQYGERWGRHWMDVWRYSDWYGLGAEVRTSHRHIWKWRDWIIESLNEDASYKQMIVEMLAGDEIAPTDPDTLRATGFLVRNWYIFNRDTQLNNTIEHTSKAFLGLTLNCTKCHDHKYDPFTQVEYYQMRAFFEPFQPRLDPVAGETNVDVNGLARVFDAYPDTPTYLYIRGNDKDPDKSKVIKPDVPAVLKLGDLDITPVSLPTESHNPNLQAFVLDAHLQIANNKLRAARSELEKTKQQLKDKTPHSTGAVTIAEKTVATALLYVTALRTAHAADVAKNNAPSPEQLTALIQTAVLAEANYNVARTDEAAVQAEQKLSSADDKTKPAAMKALETARVELNKSQQALKQATEKPTSKYTSIKVAVQAANGYGEHVAGTAARKGPFPTSSTGRRTALAKWIANDANPLTARVAVNHIWLRHFGQPLVDSVSDFGLRAPQPKQQALLDWLAVELMQNNWSMKHLHRLIVTSAAYQRSSNLQSANAETLAIDPDNDYYWRRNTIRLESQIIRDSLLMLAGTLEQTMGGPTIAPNQEDTVLRRSLYFNHSRDSRATFIATFDDADVTQCYRRGESIIPQQALALANSKLALTMSRGIANRIQRQLGPVTEISHEQFVRIAFETVLLTPASEQELTACLSMLQQMQQILIQQKYEHPTMRARENLVHALLNHNDFITVR
ncbi:MAG: DUF1553 domain-containing protein [Planctomycetaceae bacterium]|nr:DUF1553 domain-containing protein [Planctomycetaceae bacterium]MBT5599229.1 DUF1553 domain-containing protein [Planctomycetaceae bacterium]